MSEQIKTAIQEFVLELLRIVVLATIPTLVVMLETGGVDFKALGIIALVAGLRALDKALHSSGIAKRGLTRF
jgi:hypothetical protein